MTRTIGTCSLCGGAVTVPLAWYATVPPTPTCSQCGAVAAEHGPVMPMRRLGLPPGKLLVTAERWCPPEQVYWLDPPSDDIVARVDATYTDGVIDLSRLVDDTPPDCHVHAGVAALTEGS